jgi:hypothetical protein
MRSIAIVEWIVGRFTNQSRSASMIGDLVELKPQKGSLWFWWSLVGVVLSLTWRRPIAFVAAVFAGSVGSGVLWIAILRMHGQPLPEHRWMFALSMLCRIGSVLFIVLMYAAIRYGLRDKLTQLALAFASVITAAVIYCWWQPVFLAVTIAVGIFAIAASIKDSQHLRATLALTMAVAIGFFGSTLAGYMTRMESRELRAHPSFVWMVLCTYLVTVWIVTTACSRTHAWLVQNRSLDPETDSSRLP